MKKTTLPSKAKIDFEKIYKLPLDWCPLYGYVPDISMSNIASHPFVIYHDKDDPHGGLTTYNVALDIVEFIKDAREFWGVSRNHFNMIRYSRQPTVNELPVKYHTFNNKIKAANWLFCTTGHIAYYNIFWDRTSQWSPFVSSYTWDNLRGDILRKRTAGLLDIAQNNIDDVSEILGFNYTVSPCELYAIFAIHESWLLLLELITKHNNYENTDMIVERAEYVEQLIYRAGDEFDMAILERDSSLLKKKREVKVAIINEVRRLREKNKGILLATAQLEQEHPKLKNAEQIYKIFFNKYRVNESLVRRLCEGEDVGKSFFEVADDTGNIFHVYMIADKVEPDNLHYARLYQITNTEEKNTNRGIAFATYRTEYFRGGKKTQ